MIVLRNKSFSKKGEMTKTQKQDLKDELKAAGTGFLSFVPLAERSYNKYVNRHNRLIDLKDNIISRDNAEALGRVINIVGDDVDINNVERLAAGLSSTRDQVQTKRKHVISRLKKGLDLAKKKHIKDQLTNLALASSISTLSGLGMKSLHTIRDNKRREYFENKRKQKEQGRREG